MPKSGIEKIGVEAAEAFKILQPLFVKKHPKIDALDQKIRDESLLDKVSDKTDFRERVWNCLWKMKAVFYHFNNILMLEEEYFHKIEKFHEAFPYFGAYEAFGTEKMELEFEAFLFQVKACLDIFSRSFKPYLKNEPKNTKSLRKQLNKHKENPTCQKILVELKKAQWLEEFEKKTPKTYRDTITHYEKLHISPINILPRGNRAVLVPSLIQKRGKKEKISISLYAEEMMKNLFDLISICYYHLLSK